MIPLMRVRNYVASFDRNLWALAVAWLLNGLGYSMVLPFLSLYFTEARGVSMSQVGMVLFAAGVCRTLGQSVGGAVVHRLGCMRAIVGSQGVQLVSYVALASCVAWRVPLTGIGVLIALSYLANAVFQCGADVLTARLTGTQRRVEAYGITRVGLNVGWATGPAIGAFLAKTPYSLLFLLAAGVSAANIAMLVALVREPASVRGPAPGAAARNGRDDGGCGWSGLLRERALLALCAVCLLLTLLTSQLQSTLSVYTTQVTGLSRPQLGWLYTVNGLMCIAFQLPVAVAVNRRPLTGVLSAGAVVYSLAYLTFAWNAGFPGALLSIALVTMAEVVVQPAANAMASLLSRPLDLPRNMAALGMARALGLAIGPLIGGVLFDAWRSRPLALWAVLSSFGLAAAGGFLLLGRLAKIPSAQAASLAERR